ncbi:MAG: von Willebrand factor type A domain-containing protein, partial [Planctomycetia bacterium]|nr:von Willebrand factor type A domain-containing protein [Planctomycetia bacterium]
MKLSAKWLGRTGVMAAAGITAAISGCESLPMGGMACRETGYLGRIEVPADDPAFNTEEYAHFRDNPFFRTADQPLSTFSIDVDTAAYANVRRFINDGQLPPADAVRIEEMVNYFRYDYAPPADGRPFSASVEVRPAPWEPKHRLARIGIQGKAVELEEAPRANLVFLIDVSGSMESPDKLPLVKKCLRMLVKHLRVRDTVSIVVYAGNSGLVLPPTTGAAAEAMERALDRLEAGGSTNGGEGIDLAYRVAQENFVPGGVNRVILCTDGDFNVGVTSEGGLVRLIEEKRKS